MKYSKQKFSKKAAWEANTRFPRVLARSFVLLSALSAFSAMADEVPPDAERYFEEMPVVLSVSRLNQSVLEAPAAVTIIDREMIDASGARRVVDVLRLVPGFFVGYLNGNTAVASYHGLSDVYSKRMQVLIDGVSIYSPLLGWVDWAELPLALEDIERIEVVRGPNSVTYGANAFLATINIITRNPVSQPGSEVVARMGGNGIRDLVARHVVHAKDLHYSLTLGQRNDHGYEALPDSSQFSFFNFHSRYQLAPEDELMFELRGSGGRAQQGQAYVRNFYAINTSLAYVKGDPPRQRKSARESAQVRWTHAVDGDNEFWLQIHHQQQRSHEDSYVPLPLPLPGGIMWPYSYDSNYETTRDAVEFQHTRKFETPLRLVWGGELRQDWARSHAYMETDTPRKNRIARLFGNLEYRPVESLALHGGAMLENNSISGHALSPRLAATWLFAPNQSLRVGISRANRMPTINEEYGSLVFKSPADLSWFSQGKPLAILSMSSGGLQSERILSREIGYVGEIPEWHLSGDIRYFNDQVDRMILLSPTHPVVTVTNNMAWDYVNSTATARLHGLEASMRWRPWKGAQLQLTAASTRIDSDIADSAQSDPSPLFSLLYTQELPSELKFSAAYYRVGAMKWQSAPDMLSGYNTLDLRLSRQFHIGGQTLDVAVVTRNALGGYASYRQDLYDRRVSFIQLNWAY